MFKLLFIFVIVSSLVFSEVLDIRDKTYFEVPLEAAALKVIVAFKDVNRGMGPIVSIPEVDNMLKCAVSEIKPYHGLPFEPVYTISISIENTEGTCFIFIRHPNTGKLLNIIKYGNF